MSREKLVMESGDASSRLRQAVTEEVVVRRFDGVGSVAPRIVRITVEYDDPRPRPEPLIQSMMFRPALRTGVEARTRDRQNLLDPLVEGGFFLVPQQSIVTSVPYLTAGY